jgi:hypothetical protein
VESHAYVCFEASPTAKFGFPKLIMRFFGISSVFHHVNVIGTTFSERILIYLWSWYPDLENIDETKTKRFSTQDVTVIST